MVKGRAFSIAPLLLLLHNSLYPDQLTLKFCTIKYKLFLFLSRRKPIEMYLFFLQHANYGLNPHLLVSCCSLFLSQNPLDFLFLVILVIVSLFISFSY